MSHARFFGGAEVVLNNNGLSPRVITSMWYVGGRKPVAGRPVTVPSGQAQFVDLATLLPRSVGLQQVDGLELTYTGKLLEVGAQVTLRAGLLPTLSLDVPFSMAMEYKGVTQEAVWSSTFGDQAVIALANTTGVPIRVETTDSDGADEITLAAYSGRMLTRRGHPGSNTAEWLRVQTSAEPGSLRVTGFVMSIRDRVPHLLRFYDPAAVVQRDVFATNLRIKDIAASMALKNTSDAPISATPRFLDPESGVPLLTLPTIDLAPHAARLIDLAPLFSASLTMDSVSVHVENTGAPGTLIGSFRSAESGGRIAFDVPLRDSGPLRNSTGSYPWRIDGDYQTRVSITNAGTTPARFSARLTYQGGVYIFPPPLETPVGGMAIFDLRRIRDEQIPDAYGHTIPLEIEGGQFIWTVRENRVGARFAGRSEVVSRSQHVSSSYSCGQCCPDSFVYGSITPFETTFGVGDSDLLYVEEVMQNCYGSRYGQPAWPAWSVDQPWVASFSTENWGVARTMGLDAGDATGTASWWSVTYTAVQEDCIENDVQPQLPQQTKVRRVSQSPDRLQMSTGDVGEIVTTVDPSTVNATVSFNNSLTSNPHSDCNVDLVTPGNSGYGTINSPVQATPAGCSGIFTSRASANSVQSSNTTTVEVPPQILIKMIWGEAEGQSTTSQQAVGIVARNRFGDSDFGSPNTYQQAITAQQFNGVTRANNAGINGGVPPVVNNAAEVYTERAGDMTGGSKCFFSPNNTDKPSIENAANSGTTTLPVADHDPGCYPVSTRQYVLVSGAWSSFVFVRSRAATDPAVVWH